MEKHVDGVFHQSSEILEEECEDHQGSGGSQGVRGMQGPKGMRGERGKQVSFLPFQ